MQAAQEKEGDLSTLISGNREYDKSNNLNHKAILSIAELYFGSN